MVGNTSNGEITLIEQLTSNSTRIGSNGFNFQDNFSTDNALVLEEKDDQIEQLKSQIEIFESREAELNVRIEDLTEENETFDKSLKKWISKFD